MQHISLLVVDKTLSPFQVVIVPFLNANVHCELAPYRIEDWENYQFLVSNRCSITRLDCIQEHMVEGRIFRFHPYDFPPIRSLSLNDVL